MGKPKYTGILDWAGQIPRGMVRDDRAKESELQFASLYNMYMSRLVSIAISVFKWDGLPEGINQRQLEWWLFSYGKVLFLKDDGIAEDPKQRSPEGYAIMKTALMGQMDIYNIPEQRIGYTVDPQHAQVMCDSTNSCVCFDNVLGYPMFDGLRMYALFLAQIDATTWVNEYQQKTPRIIKCNEKQRLSLKNLFMNVDGYAPVVWADKDLDLAGVEVLDTSAPFIGDKNQILKHQLWNEALTFCGVENTNTDKKERMVADEVSSNMGDVEASRFTRLNMRLQFAEDVKDVFGIELVPSFRSGMYIKAEGTEGNVEVGGMQESSVENPNYEGDSGSYLWERLKKVLKGE